MHISILPLCLLATKVLADGISVLNAISSITNSTLALNVKVSTWLGDPLSTIPIIIDSTTLLSNLNAGTTVATASTNLTLAETLTVATATIALVSDVNSTLTTIIAAKEKFEKLLLGGVIWVNLELEKTATDKFSAAVIAKVPVALQALAGTIVEPIDGYFDEAIAAFAL